MKHCPFCNAELPDEASFCLSCASVLNCREEFVEKPKAEKSKGKKSKIKKDKGKKFKIKKAKTEKPKTILWNKRNQRILASAITACLVVTLTFIMLYRTTKLPLNAQNSYEPKTTLVPVTEVNGETVTDAHGEVVYEAVTLEPPTEKSIFSNLIDSIFSKDEPTEESGDESATDVSNPSSETAENPTETEQDTSNSAEDPSSDTSDNNNTSDTTQDNSSENIHNFAYTEQDGKIKITKYTGKASTVTVPAYIDGKKVAYLGEKAFTDNSHIQKIIFLGDDSGTSLFYLPYDTIVFYNLPNLTSVTFPYETNNFMIKSDGTTEFDATFYKLFTGCNRLSSVNFADPVDPAFRIELSRRMVSIDGVAFSQADSNIKYRLTYYPVARTTKDYVLPQNTHSVGTYAFSGNPYLETLTIAKATRYVDGPNFIGCTKLKSFTAAEGNARYFSENGVLYSTGVAYNGHPYAGVYYPPGKTDTFFTFTDKMNVVFDDGTFCCNPYLQTAKCPSGLRIYERVATGKYPPTALKTIYINKEKGTENTILADKYYHFEYF